MKNILKIFKKFHALLSDRPPNSGRIASRLIAVGVRGTQTVVVAGGLVNEKIVQDFKSSVQKTKKVYATAHGSFNAWRGSFHDKFLE